MDPQLDVSRLFEFSQPAKPFIPKREPSNPRVAAIGITIHLLLVLIWCVWLVFFVPRVRTEVDVPGRILSDMARFVFQQSDLLIRYYFVAVPVGIVGLIADFKAIQWMAKQTGPKWMATCFVVLVAILLVTNLVISGYVLEVQKSLPVGLIIPLL